VSDLAELIDEKPISVIKFLMTDLGVMASITQNLDPATCIAVAEGFGRIVGEFGDDEFDDEMRDMLDDEETAVATGFADDEDDEEDLEPRSPVITIMGHVDHGKTSLLDAIRNTKVTAGEAGGITQHINAYQVTHKGQPITFIDTPGHAAFTDMRERGANITDIVVLVVAADDGVKQQTADSIVCARQAGVPLVIAINKCDLETADPTRVMSDLTAYDILSESLGGDVLTAEISAKTGFGLDDLLDKIMLQAEIEDLSANPNRAAQGAVVEARIERGLGTVATTLIQKGTLRVGDNFVAGNSYGRVRALIATDGKTRLKEAGPSTPVNVVGFEGVPAAGDILVVSADEQSARLIAENRQRIAREKVSTQYQSGLMGSANALFGGSAKEKREMCVVVKADVSGSAEALSRALRELKLENDEATVTIKVLVSETGEVTKSDIAVAGVSPDTTVIAFGVSASFDAMEDARAQRIPIEYFNIIYDAIESVESRMQEVLSPTPEGEYVGAATVQEVFNIGGTGNIAGSRCTDGYIRKGSNVRVMRGDKILKYTSVKTLRNFKAETDRIESGNECGIGLVDFEDYQQGDVIECFVIM
jgi:translation initiation factor IF-2